MTGKGVVKSFAAGLRKHKTNRRRHASERNSNRGRQGDPGKQVKKMGNVKLKDIPEALNVSTVTVSNAFAGRKGVSEEVRSQVVAKAKELGYDLKKYTNKRQGFTIGVIVSEQCLELGVSFYWSMYQKVAYAASKSQSVTMLEALGQENEEKGLNIKKYCIRYAI